MPAARLFGGAILRRGTARAITVLSTASYGAAVRGACAGRSTARSTGRCATGRRNREGPRPPPADANESSRVPRSADANEVEAAVAAPPNAPVAPAVVSGRNARETCAPGASESRVRILCRRDDDREQKEVERREAFFVFRFS